MNTTTHHVYSPSSHCEHITSHQDRRLIFVQNGAGPTGLVAALALLQNGIPVRIIEKLTTHRVGSKGSGIQVLFISVILIQDAEFTC